MAINTLKIRVMTKSKTKAIMGLVKTAAGVISERLSESEEQGKRELEREFEQIQKQMEENDKRVEELKKEKLVNEENRKKHQPNLDKQRKILETEEMKYKFLVGIFDQIDERDDMIEKEIHKIRNKQTNLDKESKKMCDTLNTIVEIDEKEGKQNKQNEFLVITKKEEEENLGESQENDVIKRGRRGVDTYDPSILARNIRNTMHILVEKYADEQMVGVRLEKSDKTLQFRFENIINNFVQNVYFFVTSIEQGESVVYINKQGHDFFSVPPRIASGLTEFKANREEDQEEINDVAIAALKQLASMEAEFFEKNQDRINKLRNV